MSDNIKPYEGSNIDALQRFSDNVLEIWKDKKSIWKHFGEPAGLDETEFTFFMALGVALKANPFAREIWAVKYDKNKPAQIFLGRDFYRKKAQEQKDYNGHQTMAVFEKDTFEYDLNSPTGLPTHKFDVTKSRGNLVGAYCVAYKKGITRPFFVYVSMEEASKGQSTWKSMPVTMMEKVPEARCLRMAWQGVFKGTYAEDEAPIIQHSVEIHEAKTKMEEANKALTESIKGRIVEKKIEGQPENEWGDKLKRRFEKVYQTDGEIDYGVIAEELKRFSGVSDFADIKWQTAKSALMKFEKERFQKQLDIAIPDELDQADYLRALTSYEDNPGIGSVEDFKDVDHLYLIKGKHKNITDYDKVIYDYREKFEEQFKEG